MYDLSYNYFGVINSFSFFFFVFVQLICSSTSSFISVGTGVSIYIYNVSVVGTENAINSQRGLLLDDSLAQSATVQLPTSIDILRLDVSSIVTPSLCYSGGLISISASPLTIFHLTDSTFRSIRLGTYKKISFFIFFPFFFYSAEGVPYIFFFFFFFFSFSGNIVGGVVYVGLASVFTIRECLFEDIQTGLRGGAGLCSFCRFFFFL
jgi:hypothetical protein